MYSCESRCAGRDRSAELVGVHFGQITTAGGPRLSMVEGPRSGTGGPPFRPPHSSKVALSDRKVPTNGGYSMVLGAQSGWRVESKSLFFSCANYLPKYLAS